MMTTGRPITHVDWQVDQLPGFRRLTLSTCNVVALIVYFRENETFPRDLPDYVPLLEYLAFVPLSSEARDSLFSPVFRPPIGFPS
jgi:hypothetical protein